ncbi:TPA: hypothetical protein HA344_10750 [Candidatus Bathyarchaeota archaeon]|nr:hypothetical protein [Candidatus Bathyarchaeota archaeon]
MSNNSMELLIHKPGAHREWNESYYLCFSDKQNGLSGMTRLGFKPNKDEGATFLLLFLPDGSVAGYQTTEKINGYPDRLEAAGMTHERRPDGSWRYTFQGRMAVVKNPADFPKIRQTPALITAMAPVTMHLKFTPIQPTYEYSENMTPESLEIGKKSGDEHWEQMARISGEIRVGERVYVLRDVLGERDHTHGVRDWTGVGNWIYYVVWFNERLAINPAAIVLDDGRVSVGGYIWKDGVNTPIVGFRIIDQQYVNGIIPASSVLELTDKDDVKHILRGKAGPVVPLPFIEHGKISVLSQSFGEFELNGVKGGYGTYETLRVAK